MHLLIPYALAPGPQCREAVASLSLPHLTTLLQRMPVVQSLAGKPTDFSPLFERLQARQHGLPDADGMLPWAAADALHLGLYTEAQKYGWAWVTPCHWTPHSDYVHMDDPHHLSLTPRDMEALRHTMEPYFAEDGITLYPQTLGHAYPRWLAHGEVFANLPTASLERVSGQGVDPWMPRQLQATALRTLQNEMQMLLYTHPVNDTRADFRLPAVNSFWVSGTGNLPFAWAPPPHPAHFTQDDSLRASAIEDNPGAWKKAWEYLDATLIKKQLLLAQDGQAVQVTLCGEHRAITCADDHPGWLQRTLRRWNGPQATEVLAGL